MIEEDRNALLNRIKLRVSEEVPLQSTWIVTWLKQAMTSTKDETANYVEEWWSLNDHKKSSAHLSATHSKSIYREETERWTSWEERDEQSSQFYWSHYLQWGRVVEEANEGLLFYLSQTDLLMNRSKLNDNNTVKKKQRIKNMRFNWRLMPINCCFFRRISFRISWWQYKKGDIINWLRPPVVKYVTKFSVLRN